MHNASIYEFGKRLGMDGLSLNEQGLLVLEIENVGRLHLEKAQSENILYIYLSLPYHAYDKHIPRNIFEICSYEHNHPFILHGGAHNGWATLLVKQDATQVSASSLENTVRDLAVLLEKVFTH